jgi:hypothetical protein
MTGKLSLVDKEWIQSSYVADMFLTVHSLKEKETLMLVSS